MLLLTSQLAALWWLSVCNAWWDAWLTLWDDVFAAISGEFWPKESLASEYPDAADAHVDFGGGDE